MQILSWIAKLQYFRVPISLSIVKKNRLTAPQSKISVQNCLHKI